MAFEQFEKVGTVAEDAEGVRQRKGDLAAGGARDGDGFAHRGARHDRVPKVTFEVEPRRIAHHVMVEVRGSEFLAGAEVGVHRAVAVRGDDDQAAAGRRAANVGGGDIFDAGGADVVREHRTELVIGDAADEGTAHAHRGEAGAGVGGRAAGDFAAGAHVAVQPLGLVCIDQPHAALFDALVGEEFGFGGGDDIDKRVADGENVVAGSGHGFPASGMCVLVLAAGSSVKFIVYQDLLDKATRLLPVGVKVVFLADRGFVDHQLLRYLRAQLGWHYRIRVKSNAWVYRGGQGWMQLDQFHLGVGQARMLHHVHLHKRHSVAGVHLALARENQTGQLWQVVSSEPTTLHTLREYALRFDIEESFLDDKSNGFEWENSGLRCAVALSRLCLVMAVATLFLTLQGTAVVTAKQRRWVDPHWFRGMSYFKIGWNWVKTALTRGWDLFSLQSLTSNHDLDPAKASNPQFERRRYRVEFQVQSFDYAA